MSVATNNKFMFLSTDKSSRRIAEHITVHGLQRITAYDFYYDVTKNYKPILIAGDSEAEKIIVVEINRELNVKCSSRKCEILFDFR